MRSEKSQALVAIVVACAVSWAAGAATSLAAQSWTKYAGNPVVTERGAYQPEIVKVGGTYHMFYTFRAPAGGPYTTIEVRYRTSTDGITWSAATTVLTPGAPGAWDDAGVYVDSVIYDGGVFKMWYTGRKTSPPPTKNAIGYATSPNGITWTKHPGNPVLTVDPAPAWDSQFVREAAVVKVGSTYHMWYAGTSAWPAFRIGYATSPDGIAWTKNAANPVLGPGAPGSWEDATVYGPQVVHHGGYFHMWYSGGDGATNSEWVLGYAASCDADGVNWTKEAANPVLGLGTPPAWDCGDSVDYNYVMNDGGTWKMWYSGAGFRCGHPTDYQLGYATLVGALQTPPFPVCPADLQMVKMVDNPAPLVGQNIVFTVTVINNGPNSAVNVVVNDVLPAGLLYVSDDGGGAYNPGTGVWTIGNMLPATSVSLNITATVVSTGTIVNLAQVSSDTPDPDPGNNEDDAIVVVPEPTPTPTPTPTLPVPIPVTSGSGLLTFIALLALAGVVALWRWRG
jgi:uncharacterized repeat protein (TIGR01451 family)